MVQKEIIKGKVDEENRNIEKSTKRYAGVYILYNNVKKKKKRRYG